MRQRSAPSIYRWSRPAIVALTIFGALLTSYLTVTHFFGSGPALCAAGSGSGCDVVLNSEYARVFGIPLTIFGALGYITLGSLAAATMLVKSEDIKLKENLRRQTSFLLFLVSTAMLVFSGYLMYLIAFAIRDAAGQPTPCFYCFSSAITVTAIWLLNLYGHEWKDAGQLVFTGLIVGAIVLTGTVGVYSYQSRLAVVNQTFAGRLAQHLTASGAKMYGAFWCPHCKDQKTLFGDAVKEVPYVECAPDKNNPRKQSDLCRSKKIEGYPTWEFSGKLYEGQKSLSELADLSGYTGPRDSASK